MLSREYRRGLPQLNGQNKDSQRGSTNVHSLSTSKNHRLDRVSHDLFMIATGNITVHPNNYLYTSQFRIIRNQNRNSQKKSLWRLLGILFMLWSCSTIEYLTMTILGMLCA